MRRMESPWTFTAPRVFLLFLQASRFMRMENESSLSLTNFPPIWTDICKNKHLNVLVWNWSCCSSTAEFNFRLGFRASWTPVEVIDYIAKWWQIKWFLVCMIFTPQCLVSRRNLAKIDPINIKSKQLYSPHFGIRWKQDGNKVEIDSESTFYWHHVPQDEIVQNIETRGRSKLRPRLHGWGRILLQVAVLFARVHRNFCTVSALEWLFWMTPQGCIEPIMLHWVQISIIVSLRNRTAERGGRQNACVWQKWHDYYLYVLSSSSLDFNVFRSFSKRSVLRKTDEV